MNEDSKINETNEELGTKKKQKPGLNAVIPDEYVEQKFKGMAKDMKISQTEMFNNIFWEYLGAKRDERKQSALDLEAEIDLISKDLSNILQHFKSISDKAQNTIISIKTNADQTEKNLTLDLDTLNKRLEELVKRNEELEQSNSAFNDIKNDLETKIEELKESLNKATELVKDKDNKIHEIENSNKNFVKELTKSQSEIERLSKELANGSERIKIIEIDLKDRNEDSKDKDKTIRELEKQVNNLEKSNERHEKEANRNIEDLNVRETKIKGLEQSNTSLNDAMNTLNILKKSEISAIESKYQLYNAELETKIKSYDEVKSKEMQQMQHNLKTEYEADKKMALADMKLELAEFKSKYAEDMTKLNGLKQIKKKSEIIE